MMKSAPDHIDNTPTFVCLANPKDHRIELEDMAGNSGTAAAEWTIHRDARTGNRVIFYLTRPISAFVGVANVAGDATVYKNKRSRWHGYHMSTIENFRFIPRFVPIARVREQFPQWKWLKMPQQSAQVPPHFLSSLNRMLRTVSADVPLADFAELENLQTEIRQLVRSRSPRLRAAAISAARGICEVCQTNYAGLLNGRGVRVLQVHHRKQLSASQTPRFTKLSDLAVVCANCHLLLHLDRDRALEIKELRKMLSRSTKLH